MFLFCSPWSLSLYDRLRCTRKGISRWCGGGSRVTTNALDYFCPFRTSHSVTKNVVSSSRIHETSCTMYIAETYVLEFFWKNRSSGFENARLTETKSSRTNVTWNGDSGSARENYIGNNMSKRQNACSSPKNVQRRLELPSSITRDTKCRAAFTKNENFRSPPSPVRELRRTVNAQIWSWDQSIAWPNHFVLPTARLPFETSNLLRFVRTVCRRRFYRNVVVPELVSIGRRYCIIKL